MKRFVIAACLTAMVAAAPLALAGDMAKTAGQSYTGWIVDANCGAKNANADSKQCILDCHKKGSKLVLYVPDSKQTVAIDNQKMAESNVGMQVKVTGTMDGDTLKVSKIEPVKS